MYYFWSGLFHAAQLFWDSSTIRFMYQLTLLYCWVCYMMIGLSIHLWWTCGLFPSLALSLNKNCSEQWRATQGRQDPSWIWFVFANFRGDGQMAAEQGMNFHGTSPTVFQILYDLKIPIKLIYILVSPHTLQHSVALFKFRYSNRWVMVSHE